MAGRKLPILPSNPTPADDDLMYGVDVSDTSESAAGTSKQSTFLNIYTYILGKLSAALRLIPSGGSTGQVLAKSSNTNYEVEWATAGGGSAAVTADAPILGDGTGGDHLRLDFDAVPTDGSSKLVNSNGVYDFATPIIDITNAALNTACSGGTVNPRAMYRVTNAVGGIVRVWGKSATQVSCAGFQEGSSDGSTYLEGAWGNYDLGVDIFNAIPTIQTNTSFAPTITSEFNGTFTITNFIIDSIGDVVTFSFAGRFDLDALETNGSCKFNLPAAFQPTANWASQADVNAALSGTTGIITAESNILADDSGTKLLQVNVGDTAAGSSVRFAAVGRYKIA
jgi:hypothetical protein